MMPHYPSSTLSSRTENPYQIPGLDSNSYITFAAGGARIYHSQLGAKDNEWTNSKLRGTILFGADVSRHDSPLDRMRSTTIAKNIEPGSCWFRLLDETSGKPIWMFRIPATGFVYQQDRPFFYTFQGLSRKFGILFEDDDEAAAFSYEVKHRLSSISTSPTTSSPPTSPANRQTLAAPTPEKLKTKSRSSSFITTRSKSASPSPPPSPSKSLKRSKTPVSPSMITLPDPSSFSHVSHVGLAEFGALEAGQHNNDSWSSMLDGLKAANANSAEQAEKRPVPERANTMPASRSVESTRSLGFASRMRRKLTSPSFRVF